MKYIIPAALALLAFLAVPEIADACPNCKEAYIEGADSPVSSGYNVSILFMMIAPFVIGGVVAVRIAIAIKKNSKNQQDAGTDGTAE
ncbi:MAG: hypothetical protein CL946_13080 [Ectothiorhodospiraceae bacterium]|nr:hypothetical protein [Ectothiorhodospiraceae bacterium]